MNKADGLSDHDDIYTIAFFHSIRELCVQFFTSVYKTDEERIRKRKIDVVSIVEQYIDVLIISGIIYRVLE